MMPKQPVLNASIVPNKRSGSSKIRKDFYMIFKIFYANGSFGIQDLKILKSTRILAKTYRNDTIFFYPNLTGTFEVNDVQNLHITYYVMANYTKSTRKLALPRSAGQKVGCQPQAGGSAALRVA